MLVQLLCAIIKPGVDTYSSFMERVSSFAALFAVSVQVIAYNKVDLPDSGDYWEFVREYLVVSSKQKHQPRGRVLYRCFGVKCISEASYPRTLLSEALLATYAADNLVLNPHAQHFCLAIMFFCNVAGRRGHPQ